MKLSRHQPAQNRTCGFPASASTLGIDGESLMGQGCWMRDAGPLSDQLSSFRPRLAIFLAATPKSARAEDRDRRSVHPDCHDRFVTDRLAAQRPAPRLEIAREENFRVREWLRRTTLPYL